MILSKHVRAKTLGSCHRVRRISCRRSRSGSGASASGASRAFSCSMRKWAFSSCDRRRKLRLRISARKRSKVGTPSRTGVAGGSSGWTARASTSEINSGSLASQASRRSFRCTGMFTANSATRTRKRMGWPRRSRPAPCFGRRCYNTTWDMEGSRTRRPGVLAKVRGTTVGGVVPVHGLRPGHLADSGAETAFLVTHG